MMKKIAHIFGKMDRGGAETFIMNLYRNIDRSKIQFDFIVLSQEVGAYDEEIRALGGQVYILPSHKKRKKYYKALKELIEKERYDVLHSHVHYFSGENLRVAKNSGVKIRIAHSHNISDGHSNTFIRKLYRKYMVLLIKNNATHLLACGHEAAKSLFGDEKDPRIEIINNGIDLSMFMDNNIQKSECRKRLDIPDSAFTIGHIGRFQTQKNHELLIDIFAALYKKNKNAKLILVGDGELKPSIEKKVNNLLLKDSIKFLGVRDDINIIMKSLDVFLFPSLYEGLGIVLIEAQATGLKCVVSDTIPKEVDLTGNIEFIGLNESLDKWISSIERNEDINKIENKLQVYDIKKISIKMLEIYTK